MRNDRKTQCVFWYVCEKRWKSLCFIAKMKKRLRKHAKTIVFFDFSNHPNAQVPIFSVQKSIFGHIPGSPGSPGNGARTATSDHPNNAPGVKMTWVLTNSLKLFCPANAHSIHRVRLVVAVELDEVQAVVRFDRAVSKRGYIHNVHMHKKELARTHITLRKQFLDTWSNAITRTELKTYTWINCKSSKVVMQFSM